jgi:hypothetical protein
MINNDIGRDEIEDEISLKAATYLKPIYGNPGILITHLESSEGKFRAEVTIGWQRNFNNYREYTALVGRYTDGKVTEISFPP